MKTGKDAVPASLDNLEDELRACERTVARLGPEECSLLSRIDNLKSERANLKARLENNNYDTGSLTSVRNRIAAVDAELSGQVSRHNEIAPQIKTAHLRATEIRSGARATAQRRVEAALEAALANTQSHASYVTEKAKLEKLKGGLDSARGELERLRSGLRGKVSNDEARAEAFLRTGEIPLAAEVPTARGEIERAVGVIPVMEAAVRMQEVVFNQARSQFLGELNTALKPFREGLILRIAEGYGAAVDATQEARMLQGCMGSMVGYQGEFFAFAGVQDDPDGPFSRWLAETRRAGYGI